MFDLFNDVIVLVKREGITGEDGIKYATIETEITLQAFWQEVITDALTLQGDRVIKGQYQAGDGIALVKDSTINFDEIVKIDHYVKHNGRKYRIIQANERPRGIWHLVCRKLEG